jgi:hypothetical protein
LAAEVAFEVAFEVIFEEDDWFTYEFDWFLGVSADVDLLDTTD